MQWASIHLQRRSLMLGLRELQSPMGGNDHLKWMSGSGSYDFLVLPIVFAVDLRCRYPLCDDEDPYLTYLVCQQFSPPGLVGKR